MTSAYLASPFGLNLNAYDSFELLANYFHLLYGSLEYLRNRYAGDDHELLFLVYCRVEQKVCNVCRYI